MALQERRIPTEGAVGVTAHWHVAQERLDLIFLGVFNISPHFISYVQNAPKNWGHVNQIPLRF